MACGAPRVVATSAVVPTAPAVRTALPLVGAVLCNPLLRRLAVRRIARTPLKASPPPRQHSWDTRSYVARRHQTRRLAAPHETPWTTRCATPCSFADGLVRASLMASAAVLCWHSTAAPTRRPRRWRADAIGRECNTPHGAGVAGKRGNPSTRATFPQSHLAFEVTAGEQLAISRERNTEAPTAVARKCLQGPPPPGVSQTRTVRRQRRAPSDSPWSSPNAAIYTSAASTRAQSRGCPQSRRA